MERNWYKWLLLTTKHEKQDIWSILGKLLHNLQSVFFFGQFFSFLTQKFGKFCFSSVKIWLISLLFEKNPKFQYHKFEKKKISIHNIGILRMVPYCTCRSLIVHCHKFLWRTSQNLLSHLTTLLLPHLRNRWNFV
jgi:hypothetical protein